MYNGTKWVQASNKPEDNQWAVPTTSVLIDILTTAARNEPDNALLSKPQGLAWDPMYLSMPADAAQATRRFHKENETKIDKVCFFSLSELQSYPWHEPVQQEGWVDPREAVYVRQFGTAPRQWTKTTKDKHNQEHVTWTVPTASLCPDFVREFIPRLRDTNLDPNELRVVFFKLRVVGKASPNIVDLSKEY